MSAWKPSDFIPMTMAQMRRRGWSELDILLISGDAYFDHPTHGAAVIARVLEDAGYRVGIVAQPDWRSTTDFQVMGRPTLFVGVTAGAVDSTLNNYTAHMAKRRTDAYSPGGKGGRRPNLATAVYSNRAKEAFPGIPVVAGGIEASTRRFSYWDTLKGQVRRSILLDAKADLLVYGPGEKQALEIAHRIASGEPLKAIPGTVEFAAKPDLSSVEPLVLPSHESVCLNPRLLVEIAASLERSGLPGFDEHMIQPCSNGFIKANPPASYTTEDLDKVFSLPFTRERHPDYTEKIPALETVRWSVISHRGCPGGCSFCALAIHQGRKVIPRTKGSILEELAALANSKDFKGTITDIGGPTANAYGAIPLDSTRCADCRRSSCLFPRICPNLNKDHSRLLKLLREAGRIKKVERVYLASGIRHDLALEDPRFVREAAINHTGGHLKVAPEHVDPRTLKFMRKPPVELFERFERLFLEASKEAGLEQYLVPYFIAGFPGCAPKGGAAAEAWLRKRGQRLRQVQTFIPLPGTTAAALFATKRDTGGEEIYVPDPPEQKRQKNQLTGEGKERPTRKPRNKKRSAGTERKRRKQRTD